MNAYLRRSWPWFALIAWYALILWIIYRPPRLVSGPLLGATDTSGHVYGFWSGFGGTLLFSGLVLGPPWYLQHSCHHHFSCLRWGKYQVAGGAAGKVCKVHHPDPPQDGERHHDWIARLHGEWKRQR